MSPLGSIAPSPSAPGPPAWQASSRWRPCWDRAADAPTQSAPPAGPLVAADPEPNALLATSPGPHLAHLHRAGRPPERQCPRPSRGRRGGLPQPDRGQMTPSPPASPRGRRERWASGDYTVVWSAQTADDGEVLAGAYPFRTGVVTNPGAARLDGEWPAPWAVVPRWLVFLGTSIAAGGFVWARLLASNAGAALREVPFAAARWRSARWPRSSPPRCSRFSTACFPRQMAPLPPLAESLWAMPLGWWIQLVALFILALLCLGLLASGRATTRVPETIHLGGIGLRPRGTGRAQSHRLCPCRSPFTRSCPCPCGLPLDTGALPLAIAHQSSTALWLSGLLYLAAGWREIGSDVARFRRVRWMGGVLLAISILTGLVGTWPRFPSVGDLLADRYGQVLAGKGVIVLIILVLGLVAMVLPRRPACRPDRPLPRHPGSPGAGRPVSRRGARADGPPRNGRARDPGRRRAGGRRPGRSHRVWDGERHDPLADSTRLTRRADPRRPPHGRTRRSARTRSARRKSR